MAILKKPIVFIFFMIVVVAGFSGCAVKPQTVQVENNQKQNQTEISEVKNQEEPEKDYEIIPRDDGWVTFKSYSCGFEISYPEEFEWSQHCEEIEHPEFPQKRLIFISSNDYKSNGIYINGPSIDISISDTKNRKGKIDFNVGESIIGNDGKSGTTTTIIEELNLLKRVIKLKSTKVTGSIESPPFLRKVFYFDIDDKNFMIDSSIYFDNKEMNDMFYEIIKTIKFAD